MGIKKKVVVSLAGYKKHIFYATAPLEQIFHNVLNEYRFSKVEFFVNKRKIAYAKRGDSLKLIKANKFSYPSNFGKYKRKFSTREQDALENPFDIFDIF